jgi:hypothetical protein
MFLFRRLRVQIALAGLLTLAILLTAACNGDSATAEETSTATMAPESGATSTPPASNANPSETAASESTQSGADESAVTESSTAGSGATSAPSAQAGAGSLPGLEGYVDNRSGPVEVLQSLYSAVNLKQYARAYGYWEPSDQLAPFPEFAEGYASTEMVTLTTGAVTTGAGAGQLYFDVPVTLEVTTADGGSQTFVGCYVLHLARPEIQAEPPYTPMAIASADISEAATGADTAALMTEACQ